jgi:ApaG protein
MSKYQFTCQAVPRFLISQTSPDDQAQYVFAYTITIANTGAVPAQLIARHWTIVDGMGHTEEVKGLGVVGQQPLLRPNEAFEYTSGTHLRTPSGIMHGSFMVVAEDGTCFAAEVPAFVLDASGAMANMPARVVH